VKAAAHDRMAVSASWNGATAVTSWRILTGTDPAHLTVARTAPRSGFETTVTLPARPYVAVQPLDKNGTVLTTSTTHHH
jgi:hypothetical protein